jgi:hypothetical protein
MVTEEAVLTGLVVIVNSGDVVCPAAITTDDGGNAMLVSLLDRTIAAPDSPAGAGSEIRLPETANPPTTGFVPNNSVGTGVTVSLAERILPLWLAVMSTSVGVPTGNVVTLIAVETVAPAATVTSGGSDATAGLLLVKVTTAPPSGAGPASANVPLSS